MLTDTIALTDGTTELTFSLVSRAGMTSKRVQSTGSSLLAAQLDIANTVDLANTSKTARHLVKISWREQDATTGEVYQASVHAVLTRHPKVTDASILSQCERLGQFISTNANVTEVLRGGN